MHSVIAAAIREQKKDILYDETRPFIERLSEELDFGSQWGQGYKKAEDIWRKTLPENSVRFMEIHQCRGECLMMSEQYKEAIEEYIKALSLLNSQVWPRIEMASDIAECYLMSEDLANAKIYFMQALNDLDKWEEAEAGMQAHILLNLCEIEKHLGNRMESEDYYQRALQDAQQSGDPELISIVRTYKTQ